ncbi:hypothetical protein BDZ91DRAFT_675601, partial [Kalaharituber pfeilii]
MHTPFHQLTTALYLPISPLYSPYPWYSLESDHLDPLVLTYFPPLRGIILSYSNLRFKQPGALLHSDSPFAYTWVTVDFLVWRPERGMVLEGWVNLQSESHVGLLVLNTFNASVRRERIPAGWKWCAKRVGWKGAKRRLDEEDEEEDTGGWMDSRGNYVDGLVKLRVESFKASGHIIAIEGSLLESDHDAGQPPAAGNEARSL